MWRLADVAAGAFALVEPRARRGIVLVDGVTPHPACTAHRGDEARMRQILISLLGNGAKFAEVRNGEPDGGVVSAGVTAEPPGGMCQSGDGPWALVRVVDTGPGIAEEQREAIFEPFMQVGRRTATPWPLRGAGRPPAAD